MKFIADSMLGRLARWLRLLGYDTLYYKDIDDSLLLRIAREEKRILLTRDTRLAKVRDLPEFLLLYENDPLEQLKKVIITFNLATSRGGVTPPLSILSRCSLCNAVLSDASKEEARGVVPEYVYSTSDSFKKCSTCNRFYWKGTHHGKMLKKLKELLYY
jgi:uncharacterized protein with PIN domain